jgi:LysR family glycine cleavage system transcriptional activator
MARQIPPLSAMHAFEAAARLDGFQRAGEELHVSAGAIGHHVKQLEAWLGVVLFQRQARGVVLTSAGQRYAAALRPLLTNLLDISDALRKQGDERIVTVTSTTSLVTRWLMPRLGRLRDLHPQIELRLLASTQALDLVREGGDVAIRLGSGSYPGMKVDLLMEEWFSAVCSPAFLAAASDLKSPADLPRFTLLHDEPEIRLPNEVTWARWMKECGVAYAGGVGPRFSHTYLSLEAAANGQGIALAAQPLIAADLQSGRLVRLFNHRLLGPYHYYLLRSPQAEANPLVHAFCQWVMAEAKAEHQPECEKEAVKEPVSDP